MAITNFLNVGVNNGSEGSGTTTLNVFSNPHQITNLTAARTYILPTTNVIQGYKITITNTGDFPLTVQASGGATVAVLNVGTIVLSAGIATPTVKADWTVLQFTSKTTFATTFTFNGAGGTSGSVNIVIQRDMEMCRIYIPGPVVTSGTSSNGLVSNTTIPTQFRAASQQVFTYNSSRNNGGADAHAGAVFMNTGGVLTLVRDTGSSLFTNSSSCGFQDEFVGTYYLAL